MKKTRKLLCVLFSVLLLIGALFVPGTAAQSGALTEAASWTLENGTLTISGAGIIPESAYASMFAQYGGQATRLVVENGIVSIGGGMFFQSNNTIESVSLPASLRVIGSNCFCGCSALKEISIPNGVQMIGSGAFMNCAALEKVELPATLHVIKEDAFRGCKALKSIRLPMGLTTIGREAFMETGLESVVLPGSVRVVDGWAFSQCTSLKYAVLSGSLTTLYDCTFQNCALDYVVLPRSITTVSEYAFYYTKLNALYYEGSEAEFNAIQVLRFGDPLAVPGNTDEIFNTAELHVYYNGLLARGDMDGNGEADTGDARTVLRTAVDLETIANGTYDFYRADADFDAAVTTADARLVLRNAVGLEALSKREAPKPKTYTEQELSAIAALNGNLSAHLQQYDVPQMYDSIFIICAFPGEKDVLVKIFRGEEPAFFSKRITPSASLADLYKIAKNDDADEIMRVDPNAAPRIYEALGSFYPISFLCCTTDGRIVIFGMSNGKVSDRTVY